MERFRILWLLVIPIVFSSCKISNEVRVKHPTLDLLNHEWVSFSVKTSYYENDEFMYDRYNSTIIIHNGGDSLLHEIISINDDGSVTWMTPQRITYIDYNYKEVGIYEQANKFYDELAMDLLQGPMDYFQMYFEIYDSSLISYEHIATSFEIVGDDTLYTIPAKKTEKHCYSNGTCKLVDAPITLFYSSKTGGFVMAKQVDAKWPIRREYVSTITNITYNNCVFLLDSLFCLNSETYKGYDFVSGNTFLPHRYMTDNTIADESVLSHPLVCLSTGDTITLGELKGTTLLCIFNFFLTEETYKTIENVAAGIDNIVWLMPASNNTARLSEMAEHYHMGSNIYYTKGFNKKLSDLYKYYVINEKHQVVSINNGNNVVQWVKEIIKQ